MWQGELCRLEVQFTSTCKYCSIKFLAARNLTVFLRHRTRNASKMFSYCLKQTTVATTWQLNMRCSGTSARFWRVLFISVKNGLDPGYMLEITALGISCSRVFFFFFVCEQWFADSKVKYSWPYSLPVIDLVLLQGNILQRTISFNFGQNKFWTNLSKVFW